MATVPVRLRVRVVPGARTTAVVGRHADAWKVRVGAAPERGAANSALIALLARTLRLPRRDVRLVSGHGARDKIVELTGLTSAAAEALLSSSAAKGDAR